MQSGIYFRKHGLILDGKAHELYERAHITVQKELERNPKEHETTALMTCLINSNCFTGLDSNYTSTSEYYVDYAKGEQADIVVRYGQGGNFNAKILSRQKLLMIGECKRTMRSTGSHLLKLEWQAYRYCQIYFQSSEGREVQHIFAATMVGAHMRLWRCERDDRFDAEREKEPGEYRGYWAEVATGQPLLRPDANWSKYRDVGLDRNNNYFQQSFTMIKNNPPQEMTTDAEYWGENISKKYIGSLYGNPGCLTSESRKVSELIEDMASFGVNSGTNPSRNQTGGSSSHTASTDTPSRRQRDTPRNALYPQPSQHPSRSTAAPSSNRGRPTTYDRLDAPGMHRMSSAPRSSSTNHHPDEYTPQPIQPASSRAPTRSGQSDYRDESNLRPPRPSDHRSSTLSSSSSRAQDQGRAHSGMPPPRPERRYENIPSQQPDQTYGAPSSSSSSSRRRHHESARSASPAPRQEPRYENDSFHRAPIHVLVEVGKAEVYFHDGSRRLQTDRDAWKQSRIDGKSVRLYGSRSGQRYYYIAGRDDTSI
ncbi:hypothetical protein SBOR_2977 [Sclerotinia borealis F-4128]|uniref:Uncharacterized protein n=1 Tax=Sclerotinia borealis (strain F-4128) TaxID=1432307 RepID=W9CQ31_SCLBF|nr:hypothetical protein SBOR_2977 [Sclerotinia borealis F-4128]